MIIYVTRQCEECGKKFTYRFKHSALPRIMCDECVKDLINSILEKKSYAANRSEVGMMEDHKE